MAFCTKQNEGHDLVEGNIVEQTGPSCNLLLTELSTLSKIVEQSTNHGNREPPSAAALEQRRT